MAHGIPTLETRNWDFKNDVKVTGHLSKSPSRYYLEEFFTKLPDANAVINAAYSDADATAAANTTITLARVKANKDFEILGTNADIADFTWDTISGGIKLETGSADNDQLIILPHLDAKQTAWATVLWGTENQVIWECALFTQASVADILIWCGLKLTNTPTVITDDDQVFFRFSTDDSDTNWEVVSSIGGTDTTTDSGITVSANTLYRFKIAIDSDRKAAFYINDTRVYQSAALTNDVDLIPYVGIQQLSAGDASCTLCYEKISRVIYE